MELGALVDAIGLGVGEVDVRVDVALGVTIAVGLAEAVALGVGFADGFRVLVGVAVGDGEALSPSLAGWASSTATTSKG